LQTKSILACLFAVVLVSVAAAAADDLTKRIQEDLTALGYDTGNVRGESSTETVIAISQFQAENDLEVTGEGSTQLAEAIKAKLDERDNSSPVTQAGATQPIDPVALQAAQQACLRDKVEAAQASQKKKRGFGSLMRAVTNTAIRFGGGNDLARRVQETSYEIYRVDATADDWEKAAKDLGLTQSELEECRKPGGATLTAANSGDSAQSRGTTQQLTAEQRQAIEQSGMGGMFDRMMSGMGSNQPAFLSEPDQNIYPSDDYRFSHRVKMRITSPRGTVEPIFYVQPDAPYYARKQSRDGVTQFLVYDNELNLAVLYAEKDGEKRTIHNRINIETKALLIGAYRDAPRETPIKPLGEKIILGYPSRGYEISTLAGTTEIWLTDDAPASLFTTMFHGRAELESYAQIWCMSGIEEGGAFLLKLGLTKT